MASFPEQNKDHQGHQAMLSSWLLNNLKPQGRSDSSNSLDGSPIKSHETGTSHPNSNPNPIIEIQKASPQQKAVNLLPEIPAQTSRKLSEREQGDCDVIGMDRVLYTFTENNGHYLFIYIFIFFQKD